MYRLLRLLLRLLLVMVAACAIAAGLVAIVIALAMIVSEAGATMRVVRRPIVSTYDPGPPIAYVSNSLTTVGDASATTCATPSQSVTAGNLLVCHVQFEGAVTTVSSIADTAGNTFSQLTMQSHANNDLRGLLVYVSNCAGNAANVVTFTLAASRPFRKCACIQYSGVQASGALDTSINGTGTGTSATTSAVTTAGSYVAITTVSLYGARTQTETSPWVERMENGNVQFAEQADTVSESISGGATTWAISIEWTMQMAVFKD